MNKLEWSVHPLFFIFGLYFAATGKVFSFLVFTFSAVIHELAHALVSEKLGYRLKKISLMPYGAVISGDISGLKYVDELKIVIAGPAINFLIALFIYASWWVFPNSYPYTELAAYANLSLGLINLIPAYPLDGGRFLLATLSLKLKRKTAVKIAKISGFVFSAALLFAFAYSVFTAVNFSILFFSLFILFGAADVNSNNSYIRICEGLSPSSLHRGKEIKTLAVDESFTVKKLCSLMRDDCLYKVYVYRKNKPPVAIEPNELTSILEKKSIYDKLIS